MATVPSPTSALSPRYLLWGLGLGICLVVLFWPTFEQLLFIWEADPNYSHGPLILPVCLFLAWRIWRGDPHPGEGEILLGGLSMAAGLLVHFLWLIFRWLPIDYLALVLILRGLTVLIGGREWARGFLFPILFLFFMFPVPYAWTMKAALILQDAVTVAAALVLKLVVECDYQGNNILIYDLRDRINVAEECSGLRQIMAFFALGTLVAYFSPVNWWGKILLVLAAIPVAFLANVLRVLLMVAILGFFGREWISGWMHDVLGLLPVPLGLGLYFLIVRFLTAHLPNYEDPYP